MSYRSAIYYTSDEQRRIAEETIADVDASGLWPGKVVTEVEPAGPFWEAEPEHQDYLQHYPNGYTCHYIRPNWKRPVANRPVYAQPPGGIGRTSMADDLRGRRSRWRRPVSAQGHRRSIVFIWRSSSSPATDVHTPAQRLYRVDFAERSDDQAPDAAIDRQRQLPNRRALTVPSRQHIRDPQATTPGLPPPVSQTGSTSPATLGSDDDDAWRSNGTTAVDGEVIMTPTSADLWRGEDMSIREPGFPGSTSAARVPG